MPPAPAVSSPDFALDRALAVGLTLLLVAAWLFGGVVKDSSPRDEWVQLLALPVLATATFALLRDMPPDRWLRTGVLAMLLAAVLPALQLLPLPASLGAWSEARRILAADLAVAGVDAGLHWSLTPHATEQAFWSFIPALAAFLAGIALPARYRYAFLRTVLVLVLLNLPFAFFQMGLPPDSELRIFPYPDGVAIFGGLFINQNHHATALIYGMVLAIGLAIDAWRRRSGRVSGMLMVAYCGAALVCLAAIPQTSSRAGMVLVLPALAGVLVLAGAMPILAIGRNRRATFVAGLLALFALAGGWIALRWLAVARAEDPRFLIADATFRLGRAYFPWGSGIGSFTAAFESDLPKSLWIPNYVNHAHNEYAQWWLTGGVPALLVLALALVVFVVSGLRILRAGGRSNDAVAAAACWVAIAAALVHSWVDFPLSTTSLMTTTALLGGLMLRAVAGIGDARRRRKRHEAGNEARAHAA